MTDKIKQLQLVHDEGEIETQFSPNNVFYIQDDDKVVYYQLPYIKISATTSGTVRVQKAIYEHVATIYHETENDYIEDYYTYTPKLNKPDRFAYTGNNSTSKQDEVVYLKHINEGTYYNENIQVYEAIKDTETGEFSVGDFISAYDTTSVDVVYPPTKKL